MTVVPFPPPQAGPPAGDDHMEGLARVIVALRRLGEPATSQEIAQLICETPIGTEGLDADEVERLMRLYSDEHMPLPMFRSVTFQSVKAWSFTPEFRLRLRREGFRPRLRPIVDRARETSSEPY